MTAAVSANLVAALRGTEGEITRWIPERVLRGKKVVLRDPATNYRLPVLPDAYFVLSYGAGAAVQACFLEVDMGTSTRERFRRKTRAFQLYEDRGLLRQHWGQEALHVLVVVPSAARRAELVAVARDVLHPDWWSWCGILMVDLPDPARFREAPWRWADGQDSPLLLSTASSADHSPR